ncbi:hypothetical protein COCNU_scaffold018331G000010 [Cocos nucifera]|nr:hypothetical protein [Cocos nucifera]
MIDRVLLERRKEDKTSRTRQLFTADGSSEEISNSSLQISEWGFWKSPEKGVRIALPTSEILHPPRAVRFALTAPDLKKIHKIRPPRTERENSPFKVFPCH